MAAHVRQHIFERLDEPVLRILETSEALLHDRVELAAIRGVDSTSVEAPEGSQADLESGGRGFGIEGVIVAAVARATDATDEPELLETSRVGADACLADTEPDGKVVERAGFRLDDEVAEDSTRDPWEPFGFPEDAHRLDEVGAGGAIRHGGTVVRS